MNYTSATESELLLHAKDDAGCIDEILRRYEPMIAKMSGTFDALSRDLCMSEGANAMVDAVMHYDVGRGTRFGTYAYVCVRNRLLKCQRKARRTSEWDDVADTVSTLPTPEERVIAEESLALTKRIAKEKLSPFEYAVWRMRIDGYSYAEIAAVLSDTNKQVDVKAVNNALVRVRNKLRGTHE